MSFLNLPTYWPVILFFFGLFLISLYVFYKKTANKLNENKNNQSESGIMLLEKRIHELSQVMEQKMGETQKTMVSTQNNLQQAIQVQFGQSAKIISDVTEKLAKLDETNKQVVNFTGQLENLQKTLQNPKQRGILGEFYLENILKNVLPPGMYQMQYKFPDGDIVDAAIFVKDKIIPIDSKFSLENYNRIVEEKNPEIKLELEKKFKNDLKIRIDETSKYIKPRSGTLEFAFMFIPAEGVYYDLLSDRYGGLKINTQDLLEYAFREKRVLLVSPTNFLAYLQTVLHGLRALQIEEKAVEIRGQVEKLNKHLQTYEEFLKKLGNHLGTTVNTYNQMYQEYSKIDKDVVKITEGERTAQPVLLDKPSSNE